MKKIITFKESNIIWIILSLMFGTFVYFFFAADTTIDPNSQINSFDECVAAGFPVMESYPRQCRVPGQDTNFVEDINNPIN